MVNLNIKIQKKDLWLLSAIFVFLVGVGFVIAWDSNNPIVHGHTANEIEGGGSGGVQVYEAIGIINQPPASQTVGTWADLPDMEITFTPKSETNPISIMFSGVFYHTGTTGASARTVINIDGVDIENTRRYGHPVSSQHQEVSIIKVMTLPATSHTIKVRWASGAAGLSAYGKQRTLTIIEHEGGTMN